MQQKSSKTDFKSTLGMIALGVALMGVIEMIFKML